jgi:hypothetical protein
MRRTILGAGVLTGVLALAGCGGGSSAGTETGTTAPTTTQTTTESSPMTTAEPEQAKVVRIVVVGGVPLGGITRTTVHKGGRVVVVVRSDVSDEVHVHGYDLKANVASGKPARIAFVASMQGVFDIELESRSLQIGELTVR